MGSALFSCPQHPVGAAGVAYLPDARVGQRGTSMADDETRSEPIGRRLQVANARPDDSGHGLARLSRVSMQALASSKATWSRSSASAVRRRARCCPTPRTRGSTSSGSTGSSAPMRASDRAISSRCARSNRSRRHAWSSRPRSRTCVSRARARR
ncbi:hypothetical protein SLE2022_405720 [Rubroshorea leprosula]